MALPLRVMGKKEADYRDDVTDLLRWVGLGDRIDAYPEILSGGEKQRAAIARAVIARPELLLADEPTGNVDPAIGNRLLRLFVELNRLGTSVIIATHDYGLMEQLDAPRLVLYDGHLQVAKPRDPNLRHQGLSVDEPPHRATAGASRRPPAGALPVQDRPDRAARPPSPAMR